MKTLSCLSSIIGIFFMLLGLAFLTMKNPTANNEQSFFICSFIGMTSISIFLLINSKN